MPIDASYSQKLIFLVSARRIICRSYFKAVRVNAQSLSDGYTGITIFPFSSDLSLPDGPALRHFPVRVSISNRGGVKKNARIARLFEELESGLTAVIATAA